MPRDLTPFPLALAMEALTGGTPGARLITMAEGQWDGILQGAYRARLHPVGAGQPGASGAGVPESEPVEGAAQMSGNFARLAWASGRGARDCHPLRSLNTRSFLMFSRCVYGLSLNFH